MSGSLPRTTPQWTFTGNNEPGFNSLAFNENGIIKALGERDVFIEIDAVSLNYRDLAIVKGLYPTPTKPGTVACSDGAGRVLAAGKSVTLFRPGDRVVTLVNQEHFGGPMNKRIRNSALGGSHDGTLRRYAVFPEMGVVQAPSNLSALEAATLSCAGLTSWNALYGLRQVKAGDWVLTQGTGGVSLFAVQFAKAAGARVVATTSSEQRAEILRKLGADHIINYRATPAWGAVAKEITGGHGIDHLIEVVGAASMRQSLDAIAVEGVISVIGFVGGAANEKEPGFGDALRHVCVVRGVLAGSRPQLEDMVKAVEANESLRPIIDPQVFRGIESAKEAYQYMWDQKHQGKVCIDLTA